MGPYPKPWNSTDHTDFELRLLHFRSDFFLLARIHPKRNALSKLLFHFSLRRCRISVSVQDLCRTVEIASPDPSSLIHISRLSAPTQLSKPPWLFLSDILVPSGHI